MEQVVRVDSQEIDGDESGREWNVHYAVYTNEGRVELWQDDGEGNGIWLSDFGPTQNHRSVQRAVSVCLKLGEFLEWKGAPVL